MKKIALLTAALLLCAPAAFAAKNYQVTGPVVELNDQTMVVMKGKDKWEIQRDAASEIPADVKIGSKVTVYYTMTATKVEAKPAK